MGVTARLNFDLSRALAAVSEASLRSRFSFECFMLGLFSMAIASASPRVSTICARAAAGGNDNEMRRAAASARRTAGPDLPDLPLNPFIICDPSYRLTHLTASAVTKRLSPDLFVISTDVAPAEM